MNLKNYRPSCLDEFIGQSDIKYNLNIYLQSILATKSTLDHILLNGPSGVGKTSLAHIVANTLNVKINFIQGCHLKKLSDILNIFSLLNDNEIIFVDEAHMIDRDIFELMYTIMEDFVIDVPLGAENNQKINRLKIPKFTLICATNFLSKLPNSFIDRFPIQFFLSNYTNQDIYEILKQINTKENFSVDDNKLNFIATISKRNPRNAINLFKRYLDYHLIDPDEDIKIIFQRIGIYQDGLTKLDIDYLKLLQEYNYISLQGISQNLGVDKNSIENKIEVFLIKENYIKINSKGRHLTDKAKLYLEQLSK